MEEDLEKLQRVCELRNIHRFSPEEMAELLEDGESVEWIVAQVLPEGPEEAAADLRGALEGLAARVAPAPLAAIPEEDTPEVLLEEEETTEALLEEEEPPPAPDLGEIDWQTLKGALPPGVDIGQVRKLVESPRGKLMADFGTFCQERGVDPEGDQEEMTELMRQLEEEWLQTPREGLQGKKPAELLGEERLLPVRVETFRREGPKVGRNDPCPCGSGKKYKKCCGKGG